MATMNVAAAGGPVGGGMMMMNNGSPAMPPGMSVDLSRRNLNTYIYDYLLRHGHYDVARAVSTDQGFDFNKISKTSPGRGKNGEMNGDDGQDKDDAPDDLPRPYGWDSNPNNPGFLLEWFNVFYDMFQARSSKATNPQSMAYMNSEKTNQRARDLQQNTNVNRQNLNPAMMRQMNGVNGMKQPLTPQQMQMMSQRKAMAAQQGGNQPNQGEAEMNGVRPGSPTEGDVGSPSKRPRIENGQQQFNNNMMPNGRVGAVPAGAQGQMMIQSGFNPAMNPQMRQNGAMPPKGVQGQMPGMMMGQAGSPMMQGMQQNFATDAAQMEFMRNQQNAMGGGQPPMQGNGGQSGNHALQDYQMQLMLLEQQNKKRLMMARQEQHENNPNAAGQMQGVNMPTGMSPGSRTGTSPNPEAMAGRSPAGMNFIGNMQGNFDPQMFNMDKAQMQMGPGPQGMRPPTSNAEMNMRAQQGRPNQFQGGQPMQQQGSQAGQQIGTPNNRDMPPPQAPAGGSAQRNQGGSPSNGNAPPTPSQSNKPNPKGNKKGAAKDGDNRKRPGKKASNVGANAGDDNPPATPTPSTPVTGNNQSQMAGKGQPNMQGQHQQNMGMNQQMQQNDLGFGFGDGSNNGDSNGFNLDFGALENADVLENFDFDSFLNTSAEDSLGVDFSGDFGADFTMNPEG